MKLNKFCRSVVGFALLFIAVSAHADKRFTGMVNGDGSAFYIEVSGPVPASNFVSPVGHQANPDFKIMPQTKERMGLRATATAVEVMQTADSKFVGLQKQFAKREWFLKLIKDISPLYGVEPAAVLGAVLGEMTFNNRLETLMQNAAATLASGLLFSQVGDVEEILKDPAFRECFMERGDYWSWNCANQVWARSINYVSGDKAASPRGTFLARAKASDKTFTDMLRPVTGGTYGPAQMGLMKALMMNDDVHRVSRGKIPKLGLRQMPEVLTTVIDAETSVHLVAATISRSIDAYKRFASTDISKNIGLQATLFNLGYEAERAIVMNGENARAKTPRRPRENYFGWFVNRHEAEIRALVSH